jgi:hypothetical protein
VTQGHRRRALNQPRLELRSTSKDYFMQLRSIALSSWPRWVLSLLLLAATMQRSSGDFLENIERRLSITLFHDQVRLKVSGLLDFEGYFLDQPTPALIYTDNDFFFSPRLTLFLDAQIGPYVYAFAQARVDRGFDPSEQGAEARLDEYAVIISPWKDGRLSVKAGQFATVVGNWVPRHYSWDNPFINAPLSYESLTPVWDRFAPHNRNEFRSWGHLRGTDNGDYSDKTLRNPVIWGPSYATGIAVSGALGRFDYAVEMKNAALASRPETWSLSDRGFENPTFSGRVGIRPNLMWNLGFSGSTGPYLVSDAAPTLPAGRDIGDYRQFVLGQDISFAWHRFQLWAEVFESRFQVANIGNADLLSYYIEAKYKITPQFFAALRWNQQLFDTISDGDRAAPWGNDISRIDAVLGYRFTDYLQVKAQYSFTHGVAALHQDAHLAAGQLTVKF